MKLIVVLSMGFLLTSCGIVSIYNSEQKTYYAKDPNLEYIKEFSELCIVKEYFEKQNEAVPQDLLDQIKKKSLNCPDLSTTDKNVSVKFFDNISAEN